jgi:hypothetical protein
MPSSQLLQFDFELKPPTSGKEPKYRDPQQRAVQ